MIEWGCPGLGFSNVLCLTCFAAPGENRIRGFDGCYHRSSRRIPRLYLTCSAAVGGAPPPVLQMQRFRMGIPYVAIKHCQSGVRLHLLCRSHASVSRLQVGKP